MGRVLRAVCGVGVTASIAIAPSCGDGDRGLGESTPASDTVRILAYNIHHGEGMDSVVDLERIAELIRDVDPDLVALQEVDSVTHRTGGVDQAQELARRTGLAPVFGSFMPYDGGAYGMAVLSRWHPEEARNLRLPDGDEPRTAVSVSVRLPGGNVMQFVGIHLYRTEEERLLQARRLEELVSGESVPTILAGDFNSTPGSAVMDHLGTSWEVVEKGKDRFTFPAHAPEREIDFVLVRPRGRFQILSSRLLDEPVMSDHRPLLVELSILPEARPSP